MRKEYNNAELTLISLEKADVITASGDVITESSEFESGEKTIVKTKIISQYEQETKEGKKKARRASAIAGGFLGVGGVLIQESYNNHNREMEQIVTFLVIYEDGSRETVDVKKDGKAYQKLIMYLE
ncbi:MAG: hypothetical protein IJR88_06375 [Clostridia bacterium]|nr:hypothetical protein [Clostridia bacterium]